MDRPTRRSANGTASTATKDNANPAISSRRRRRDAESVASVSDGAETDSSSVGTEMGTRHAAATKATSTLPKGKRGGHNKAKLASPEKDQDNDDHHDGDDHDGEDPAKASASPATPVHETGGDDDNATGDAEDEDQAPSGYATRARRERSQSVVSTTSDTSSIASEVPEDPLRPELHGEKLQELEKKKKMVEDGTLAEFCRRVAEFKEERNRLLQTAEWHKNLQVKNTQDLYGFEVQRAHNIWKDNKDAVKVSMLSKADALLAQLKKELATLQEAGELPTHVVLEPRNLVPVKPAPPTDPTAQSAPQPIKRRKVSAPVPDNVLRLPLDDVTSDLAGILQEREAASTKIHAALAEPQLELSVDRRRLIVGKYVFEEGDEVVVTAVVLKQDYTGVISSVSDREIYVVLTSGQKVRVAVDHIAQRRCEIRPFLRGAAGIESLQTSGWVECEPF